jgi:hypothetical protein
MNELNLMTWFSKRELDYCPKHFVRTNTPINDDKHQYILENFRGRYFIGYNQTNIDSSLLSLLEEMYPYFEDPQEAVMYELVWS